MRGTISELQQSEYIVYNLFVRKDADDERSRNLSKIIDKIQQMPVISIPVHFDRKEGESSAKRSIVLRPFITRDFMTGKAALPGRDIPEEVSWVFLFTYKLNVFSISWRWM